MLHALQALGISPGAATVYLALVAEPGANLADLAARSGLQDGEIDDAVAQLTRLGLIEPVRPGRAAENIVRLADPGLAFSASLRQREAELGRQQQELAEARATIAAAATAYQTWAGHPARCARPLASQQETIEAGRQLMTSAVDECLIALPDPVGTLGKECAQLADRASRGARVAIICADAAPVIGRQSQPGPTGARRHRCAYAADGHSAADRCPPRSSAVARRSGNLHAGGSGMTGTSCHG